jgi:hypothetical protein
LSKKGEERRIKKVEGNQKRRERKKHKFFSTDSIL